MAAFCPVDGYAFAADAVRCTHCGYLRVHVQLAANGTTDDTRREFPAHAPSPSPPPPPPSDEQPLSAGDLPWPSLSPEEPAVPFRKILYTKQPYPDNYVDVTFLQHLQRNTNVRARDYWTTVKDSGVFLQHGTSVLIFVALFFFLYTNQVSAELMTWTGALLTIAGYLFWDVSIRQIDSQFTFQRRRTFKSTLFIFAMLLGLSPILRTLTKDISEDTIWAMTVCMFLANMLLHDYGSSGRGSIQYSGAMSTNAAIFASVLLASRLPHDRHVFALTSIAVEWFALFPILRGHLKRLSMHHSIALSCILTATCTWMYSRLSWTLVLIYLAAAIFITFVCPWWLIAMQKYKNEIHGPWDEARPRLQHRTLSE